MKAHFYHIIFIASVWGFIFFVTNKKANLIFSPKSSLVINGKSNVNTFTCSYNSKKLNDTLMIQYRRKGNQYFFDNANIELNNREFDCGGKAINRDFHKLLKTKDQPSIKMRLIKVDFFENKDSIHANIEYEINNISKRYLVPIKYSKKLNQIHISGQKKLNIKDFDLKPPKKLLGIIKVKENISVNFNFLIGEK